MTQTQTTYLVVSLTVGLLVSSPALSADKLQTVELTTADGVEISARYQPGSLGNKSPSVLILDGIGENRRPTVCDAIATELQKQGCATLCLDFRGHGESRVVTTAFWDDLTNRKMVRGYKLRDAPERISFSDFKSGYLRTLVNDIAAARAFLDRRNDAGECNSRYLMVVGIREGATLGAMWVATEWCRYQVTGGFQTRLSTTAEGRDILGCVWIEPELELDKQKVAMTEYIKQAVSKRTSHVGLIHTADNAPLVRLGAQCAETLNKKYGRVFQATVFDAVRGGNATDQKSLVSRVVTLITQMRKVQEPPLWDDRNFTGKRFAWSLPGGGIVLAKDENEMTFKLVPIDRLIAR